MNTKNLFPKGIVKTTFSSSGAIVVDIPKKIKMIKAFRCQLDNLGFIVSGFDVISSREPISQLINAQINKSDSRYQEDKKYHNARQSMYRYLQNPEMLHKDYKTLGNFFKAIDEVYKTGDSKSASAHVVVLNRIFRKNKGEALYKKIEELKGF